MLRLCIAVALMVAAIGCTQRGSYSEYASLPAQGWAYGDTVTFSPDSLAGGPMLVALRHNGSFAYSSLWIEISDSTRRDTMEIALCDSYGRWLGSGIGTSYQLTAPAPFAPRPGSRLNIRHVMRVDTIKGIEQIGLLPAN